MCYEFIDHMIVGVFDYLSLRYVIILHWRENYCFLLVLNNFQLDNGSNLVCYHGIYYITPAYCCWIF